MFSSFFTVVVPPCECSSVRLLIHTKALRVQRKQGEKERRLSQVKLTGDRVVSTATVRNQSKITK